ncbi:MAG: metallophosphoesterase [Patescibacteria group bacterium]|nr:metallophosphoesterase [Patescibacteria group bacterium]
MVLASDFHVGIYTDKRLLKKTVDKINKSKPDLILLAGDFVWRLPENKIAEKLDSLKNLSAPAYAVIGNHDDGYPGVDVSPKIIRTLNEYGIKILDNKLETIAIKNKEIDLIGLKELWSGEANFSLPQKANEEHYRLLLTHNPDAVLKLKEGSVDLAVAGHTHGGQVKIPFIYKYFIPTENDFVEGFYFVNGIKTFVTSGIGTVGLPFRFLTVPEIDILEIE